jgi:T-complex protein 1 subunit eta
LETAGRIGTHKQQPQIILLREGTDTSQGKGQLLSNINACLAVGDTIRTTLGPRGMDKLIVDSRSGYLLLRWFFFLFFFGLLGRVYLVCCVYAWMGLEGGGGIKWFELAEGGRVM